MKSICVLVALCFVPDFFFAQHVLDQYVQQAIDQNLQVREKKFNEETKALQVKEASRMWGPEVSFQGNYTLAAGGRQIDLPVGDLMNPVYAELNRIVDEERYAPIENQSVHFLPNNYYDLKFRITQPILRPDIKYNKLIKTEESALAGLQTRQTTRELVEHVKTAYYQYLQAGELISILDQGISLLTENKRITESLIKNGMAIPSARIRIESDLNALLARKEQAKVNLKNAATYFNFLLHRDGDEPIIVDSISGLPPMPSALTAEQREELLQIERGENIHELALNLEEKYHNPRLGLQLDLGSQAYAVDWGGYVLAGVGVEIPIWDNNRNSLRRQQIESSLQADQASYAWARDAFQTEIQNETKSLSADFTLYESFTSIVKSNERFYDETVKRYKEGLANYIELLDARTQVTRSQLEQNVAKYQAWIRYVHLERLAASYPIP